MDTSTAPAPPRALPAVAPAPSEPEASSRGIKTSRWEIIRTSLGIRQEKQNKWRELINNIKTRNSVFDLIKEELDSLSNHSDLHQARIDELKVLYKKYHPNNHDWTKTPESNNNLHMFNNNKNLDALTIASILSKAKSVKNKGLSQIIGGDPTPVNFQEVTSSNCIGLKEFIKLFAVKYKNGSYNSAFDMKLKYRSLKKGGRKKDVFILKIIFDDIMKTLTTELSLNYIDKLSDKIDTEDDEPAPEPTTEYAVEPEPDDGDSPFKTPEEILNIVINIVESKIDNFIKETQGQIDENPDYLEKIGLMKDYNLSDLRIELMEIFNFLIYLIGSNKCGELITDLNDKLEKTTKTILNSIPENNDDEDGGDEDDDMLSSVKSISDLISNFDTEPESELVEPEYKITPHIKQQLFKKAFMAKLKTSGEELSELDNGYVTSFTNAVAVFGSNAMGKVDNGIYNSGEEEDEIDFKSGWDNTKPVLSGFKDDETKLSIAKGLDKIVNILDLNKITIIAVYSLLSGDIDAILNSKVFSVCKMFKFFNTSNDEEGTNMLIVAWHNMKDYIMDKLLNKLIISVNKNKKIRSSKLIKKYKKFIDKGNEGSDIRSKLLIKLSNIVGEVLTREIGGNLINLVLDFFSKLAEKIPIVGWFVSAINNLLSAGKNIMENIMDNLLISELYGLKLETNKFLDDAKSTTEELTSGVKDGEDGEDVSEKPDDAGGEPVDADEVESPRNTYTSVPVNLTSLSLANKGKVVDKKPVAEGKPTPRSILRKSSAQRQDERNRRFDVELETIYQSVLPYYKKITNGMGII